MALFDEILINDFVIEGPVHFSEKNMIQLIDLSGLIGSV